MPTQEERLTALEQSQVRFGEAISDLNHHVTMLPGVVQKQEWDMKEMKGSLRTLEQNVQTLDRNINGRFEEQDKKLDQILRLLNTKASKPDQEP